MTSVAYHPNGDLLVVGLGGALGGGGAKTKKDGAFVLLNEPDLSVTYEARDAKHPITVVRYSPDGEYMALGSQVRIVSYRVVSCRVVSYRVVSCRIVSCRIVSYRVVSCRVEEVIRWRALHPTIPYPAQPYRTQQYPPHPNPPHPNLQDSCVYLYATAEDYEAIGKCRRHNEPVTHLDFSEDSKWLQVGVTTQGY